MHKIEKYHNTLSRKHQIIRALWSITWTLGASWIPRSIASGWKRFLLRLFGAKIAPTAVVYSKAKIYFPSNLIMDEYACIDSNVNVYNVNKVYLGKRATISQGCLICPGSHDISDPKNLMISSPIHINDLAWIAAEAFIGYGVTIGEGAVVGARAAVFKDVEPWTIVGGNPAKPIKKRVLRDG